MDPITPEEAIRRAKSTMGVVESTPARAWRVRRLDRAEAYYLVELGPQNAAAGLATVDCNSGEIGVHATLPGTGPHITVDAAAAIELAAAGAAAEAECVWMPSKATRSPLYPVWEVRTAAATKYVDQQRRVWDRIEAGGLGG